MFLVLWLEPLRRGNQPRVRFLIAGAILLSIALTVPGLLAPLNQIWTRLAVMIGQITTPILLGIMFLGLFTVLGLILRLFRRDSLRLRSAEFTDTYWIRREPPSIGPGPQADGMKHMS